MKAKLLNIKNNIGHAFLFLVMGWVVFALLLQLSLVAVHFSGNTQLETDIANWFSWKFDGTFKNSPENIWYNAADHIWVESVENKVKVGKLAGNRNLAFGVKNIAEEAILDKEYELTKDSSALRLNLEIVYFDIQQTATGVSVFHKTENETIIRIKGILYNGDKKVKEYVATGKSAEISTSTMIIDEGGGFNQASARSALKKTIITLIEKLL
mgnify:CR=1 FL=1